MSEYTIKEEAVSVNESEPKVERAIEVLSEPKQVGMVFVPSFGCYVELKEFLRMRISLMKKKNEARKLLHSKGVIQMKGYNDYDKYEYFTESQYKELAVELFSKTGLEFKADILSIETIDGSANMKFAKRVNMLFELCDMDTGFSELSSFSGEAFDKGDKALPKAMTTALKYYIAETFHVPTGDEPEKVATPVVEPVEETPEFITPEHISIIESTYGKMGKIALLLSAKEVNTVEELTYEQGCQIVKELQDVARNKQAKSIV